MQRGLLLGLGVLVLATSGGWAAHEGDGVPFADATRWKTDFRKHTVPLR